MVRMLRCCGHAEALNAATWLLGRDAAERACCALEGRK